jgi:hypothetical protein
MPDWKPVTEWLGEHPVSIEKRVEDKPDTESASYHFLRDPSGLTKFLQRLLFVSILVACVALFDDLAEFLQVQSGKATPDQVVDNDPVQGIVGLLQSGLGLVTGITFLKWVYRAYKNIQGFGAENLRYSPGWAVAYYFMPVLGLIRPVLADRELVGVISLLCARHSDFASTRSAGLEQRPMELCCDCGHPRRPDFHPVVNCGAASCHRGFSTAKGARGWHRSRLGGIKVLFDVQSPESARLHVKETPKNFAEVIGILVPAGARNLVDVH